MTAMISPVFFLTGKRFIYCNICILVYYWTDDVVLEVIKFGATKQFNIYFCCFKWIIKLTPLYSFDMFVFNNHYFPRIFSHLDKIYLTVGSYHVTYVFQSESTLYSCLNVKELLARSRRDIWRLSDCNGTRTHNHLVCKRTVNHLAKLSSLDKWSSARLRTKWLWFWVPIQSHKIYFLVLLSGFGYNFSFYTYICSTSYFSVFFCCFSNFHHVKICLWHRSASFNAVCRDIHWLYVFASTNRFSMRHIAWCLICFFFQLKFYYFPIGFALMVTFFDIFCYFFDFYFDPWCSF